MFSPSLISMMLHSLWSDLDDSRDSVQYSNFNAVAATLRELISKYHSTSPAAQLPQIPMVGRSNTIAIDRLSAAFSPFIRIRAFAGRVFVWGRIPVDLL